LTYYTIDQTGSATTTFAWEMATGTSAFATSSVSLTGASIMNRNEVPTSTKVSLTGPSQQKQTMSEAVVIGPLEWIVLRIDAGGTTGDYLDEGILNGNNTFDGWISLEFTRALIR